jgi:penicillin amidase
VPDILQSAIHIKLKDEVYLMPKQSLALVLILTLTLLANILPPNRVAAQKTETTVVAPATTLALDGLRERVTVRRDERGIPYIEANNEADLNLAQGYITASDRLWQMELFRRTARGELSEIFGKTTLEGDKQHRALGFAQMSELQAKQAPPRLRAALENYARGVNNYISRLNVKTMPPEFQILQLVPRPWTPADSLVAAKLFDEALSTSWRADITRAAFVDLPPVQREALFPETSPLDIILVGSDHGQKKRAAVSSSSSPMNPTTTASSFKDVTQRVEALSELAANAETTQRVLERLGLYAEDCAASNNWVVSGKRTASGQPLLANDPHLSPSAPSIWYMVNLSAPGIHVAGVSVAGLPGVGIGHNENIAWGVTSLEADVQDLYRENFSVADPARYMTPAGWRDAVVRHEEIKVRKGFTDAATDIVPMDVTVTRHGPIFYEKDGARYALRWAALDAAANLAGTFYALNVARDWNEFRNALKDYSGPPFNFVYADTKGHIGYYGVGQFPIRKTGKGQLPYDGATDEGEWTGFIPFDALPHLYDPPSGLIVTANSRIVGLDYPYQLTVQPLAAYRTRRINELLQAKTKLTIDDFRTIQADTYALNGITFARAFVKALTPYANDASNAARKQKGANVVEIQDNLRDRLNLLQSWDGLVIPDSRAALLVSHMRDAFRRRVLEGALGVERAKLYRYSNADTFLDRVITEQPPEWLPKEFKSYTELFLACDADARAELTKAYGADESQWTWGRESIARFPHPLASVPLIGLQFNILPFPQNGDRASFPTVNRGTAVSMRLIADPADWDRTQQGIALGESGIPQSPHWSDQLQDWRNVTPRAFPFTKTAVAPAAKETLTLAPMKVTIQPMK